MKIKPEKWASKVLEESGPLYYIVSALGDMCGERRFSFCLDLCIIHCVSLQLELSVHSDLC